MREYVFGSDAKFKQLRAELEDGQCHVCNNCAFPASFSQQFGRIGFEKDRGIYRLLIDYGITCSRSRGGNAMKQCRQWLHDGEIMFLDFNDLKVFLKSLKTLY